MENPYYIFIVYSSLFVVGTIFSLLINGLFLKFAHSLGIRNSDEQFVIRWGSRSKPALGGISFYIVFLLSIASYSIFFNQSITSLHIKFMGTLAAVTLAFLVGLADDAYNTKPFLKFSAQFLCGIILILTGNYISIFDNQILNYAITLFWIVGMMNSINMLDNMDAITSVVSVSVILSALFIVNYFNGITSIYGIMLVGVLASLVGFLYYNWHPSKIYMGDTGSQFLGCLLGSIGITYFWNNSEIGATSIPTKQLIIAVLVFIIPLIDTTTVVINRLLKKQSPFIGGKDHTTHHLSYLGLTDSQVALTFLFLSLLSFFFVIIITKFIKDWTHFHTLIFGLYIVSVFLILYSITKISHKKDAANKEENEEEEGKIIKMRG